MDDRQGTKEAPAVAMGEMMGVGAEGAKRGT